MFLEKLDSLRGYLAEPKKIVRDLSRIECVAEDFIHYQLHFFLGAGGKRNQIGSQFL
jgi:hypothetical protein